MGEWIKTSERKPEIGVSVFSAWIYLWYGRFDGYAYGSCSRFDDKRWQDEYGKSCNQPEYWMPIPPLPEKEEK